MRLTPLTDEMIDQLVQWRSQPEAREHQPITAMSREQLRRYLQSRKSAKLADLADNDYLLIIEDENREEAVGWITLEIISRLHGLARIGYTISKEFWRQGYATAAVKAIVCQLFTETPVERIEADCSVHNPASRRVLEKCGFTYVGLKRRYLVIQGERIDHHYFELCKDDYHGK
ncbi:MAG: GNAT family N-acetyltransferase [Fidelibacterota bacterium]|nr:MAG: GNAT family N-acetyltransferase [Candidatus Neomarinimicrobiota bacterium]